MAYTGPFEVPPLLPGNEMFPEGAHCPQMSGLPYEGLIKGPAYYAYSSSSTQYLAVCEESQSGYYSLHRIVSVLVSEGQKTNTTAEPYPNGFAEEGGIHVSIMHTDLATSETEYLQGVNLNYGLDCIIDSNIVYEGNGLWSYYRKYYTTYYFWKLMDTPPSCPIGTSYDPVYGTCVPDPRFEWDPVTESYVCSGLCYEISGDTENTITEPTIKRYTITVDECYEPGILTEDTIVDISYSGSAVKSIHFNGPDQVTIPSGQSSVSFDIELKKYEGYDVYIDINVSSINVGAQELVENCDPFRITILHGTTIDENSPPCCNFVPKDYKKTMLTDTCGAKFPEPPYEEEKHGSCGYFNSNFKEWMNCNGFTEAKYIGNVLKDGTILEE